MVLYFVSLVPLPLRVVRQLSPLSPTSESGEAIVSIISLPLRVVEQLTPLPTSQSGEAVVSHVPYI